MLGFRSLSASAFTHALTLTLTAAAFGVLAAACAGSRGEDGPPAVEPAGAATGDTAAPAPVVHQHASSEAGILANAYLIEGEQGVVAVDATLTVSEARALRARLDAIGKPLLAVLLTHGHPDHYNGAAALVEGTGAPIVATAAVAEVIRRDDAAKEEQWRPMFGDEWPAKRAFPTRIVADGETVRFGALELTVRDLGPAESDADSVWILGGDAPAAFVGDLVFNQVHAYMSDGHTGAWLEKLAALERDLAEVEVLYPGHGDPGGRELLAAQRAYLEAYRGEVARLAGGKPALGDEGRAELTRVMNERLGSNRLEFLVGLGADAVASELAAD
jgi:glyoxylase-like metal-dependent hydrolase (beta-lactamase superfamily II)